MKNDTAYAPLIIACIMFAIIGGFYWLVFLGGALYPEDKTIVIESVNYHSFVTSESWRTGEPTSHYTEIRIRDTNGSEYEYSVNKHMFDNPMYADIGNGWNFGHDKTIEKGGTYRITIWHSIFGGYSKDSMSNWNPNPEISKIVRLD